MKDTLWQALGVVTMSMDLPLGLWPVTLVLAALAIWSGYVLIQARRLRSIPTVFVIVSSVVAFLAIPIYAAVFWADHEVDTPETQELPTNALGVLVWGYFGLVALTVALAKGYRLPLAGVAAFLVWMNCGVMLVAIMAVSGLWL